MAFWIYQSTNTEVVPTNETILGIKQTSAFGQNGASKISTYHTLVRSDISEDQLTSFTGESHISIRIFKAIHI